MCTDNKVAQLFTRAENKDSFKTIFFTYWSVLRKFQVLFYARLAQLVNAHALQAWDSGFKSRASHQWRTSQMAKTQACKALSSRFKSGVRLHMGR